MSKILTDNQYYSQIADVIREQNGTNNTYTPQQMVSALKDLFYEEVEGVPPLSFEANGNNLLDYRIDGESGGVGERTKNLCTNKNMVVGLYSAGAMVSSNLFITSDFIPVEYGKTYTASLFDLDENRVNNMVYEKINANKEWIGQNSTDKSITINDENIAYLRIRNFAANSQYITNNNYKYQLEEGSTATDYEPYGYKVPVVVNGKNLLQNKATSRTLNGVTCTVNDDKSVTFTGSPERSFDLIFNNSLILNPGTYIYTNGLTQSYSRIRVDMYVAGTGGNINYWANPSVTFTTTNTYKFVSRIFIQSNAGELAGLTIYPMIRKADIEDNTYEQYIEETTNIYLDEPIGENESISLSDIEVDIPTIEGTNTLSIGTTVQPSNMYIQAPKDSIEATQIANRLEEI